MPELSRTDSIGSLKRRASAARDTLVKRWPDRHASGKRKERKGDSDKWAGKFPSGAKGKGVRSFVARPTDTATVDSICTKCLFCAFVQIILCLIPKLFAQQ